MIRKGKIIPLAEFNQSTGQSLTTTCYVFKTDILKNNVQSVATKIFNAVHSALDDGSYRIYFCPFFTSNEIKAAGESCFVDPGGVFVASEYTNYANMAANNYPVIDLTISDGELISYSVPSVAGGLFVPSTVVTKIGLLSIGSL